MNAYNSITPETIQKDMRYLQLLSHSFPTIADASTEIINLEAILNLPKGTEHFLADLHGEYEAFQHVLRNASGAIKRKVNEIFGNTLRENEKKELCTLIYYPEQKLDLVKAVETDLDDWYVITLNQLVRVCQNVASKYTRSKVRKALPKEFAYILEELLHEDNVSRERPYILNVRLIKSFIVLTSQSLAYTAKTFLSYSVRCSILLAKKFTSSIFRNCPSSFCKGLSFSNTFTSLPLGIVSLMPICLI